MDYSERRGHQIMGPLPRFSRYELLRHRQLARVVMTLDEAKARLAGSRSKRDRQYFTRIVELAR